MEKDNIGENSYLAKVKEVIIAVNQSGISEVLGLESIKSLFFNAEEYSIISKLIKEGDITKVKEWSSNLSKRSEYLDILLFCDQNGREYIVSIYDSDDLMQDPEVIEIFPL